MDRQKYILDRMCIMYLCFLRLIMEDSHISEVEVYNYWTGLLSGSNLVGLALIKGIEEGGYFSGYLEVIARYVVYGYPPLENLLTTEELEESLDRSRAAYKRLLNTYFDLE